MSERSGKVLSPGIGACYMAGATKRSGGNVAEVNSPCGAGAKWAVGGWSNEGDAGAEGGEAQVGTLKMFAVQDIPVKVKPGQMGLVHNGPLW